MNAARLRPRPEQVEELIRGVSLPFPPIPHRVLLVLADILEQVWKDLSERHSAILNHGSEDEISALLIARLNAMRDEDACLETIVSGVSRGSETISFDGRHLKKQPDLSFHLTRRSFSFPLIAECKLIDHQNGKTVRLYCNDGLARFPQGDYAWGTREGLMLAYVRDESSIAARLTPYLAASQKNKPDPFGTELLPCPILPGNSGLAQSRHHRSFTYPSTARSSPGPIVLWHVWLSTTT